MTIIEVFAVAVAGFVGAVIRFLIASRMNNKEGIPMGTLAVNLTGSLLIGFLIGLELPTIWAIFLVSGFLGALTTFSTLIKEILFLWRDGQRKESILYIVYTFLGVPIAYVGFIIGQIS